MDRRILWTAAAIALFVVGFRMSAQDQPHRREFPQHLQIGRYQLASAGPMMFLLDTASGQVWKRAENGDWNDEGNPTRMKTPSDGESKKAATLDLKGKSVEMVIIQREERAVPGSDGTVLIRLGDITDGQAFLTIADSDGKDLLSRSSVKPGDVVYFQVGKQHFAVKVNELRNILIGDDFAKLTVVEGKRAFKDDIDNEEKK